MRDLQALVCVLSTFMCSVHMVTCAIAQLDRCQEAFKRVHRTSRYQAMGLLYHFGSRYC
ncbi:hypothetical protein BDZ91DRAFT_730977 [Kalaharituber pfeilii]|nr:hypothetical protein BDZ91DRAFT_730977 [Kalaharituber pfeilii]